MRFPVSELPTHHLKNPDSDDLYNARIEEPTVALGELIYLIFRFPYANAAAEVYLKGTPSERCAQIENLYVHGNGKDHLGYGTTLLAWIAKEAKLRQCKAAYALDISNVFVLNSIERLLAAGDIADVACLRSTGQYDPWAYRRCLNAFTSPDRLSLEEAKEYIADTSKYMPAIDACTLL